VRRAHRGGFFVNSLFARRRLLAVSAAASLGFISTRLESGFCGRQWWVTHAGLLYLNQQESP